MRRVNGGVLRRGHRVSASASPTVSFLSLVKTGLTIGQEELRLPLWYYGEELHQKLHEQGLQWSFHCRELADATAWSVWMFSCHYGKTKAEELLRTPLCAQGLGWRTGSDQRK